MIRSVDPQDAAPCCALYNHYIEHSIVTFEEEAVSVDEFRHRIETITESYPWLVHEEDDAIGGYVYAGPWKMRNAYRFSAESAVYMAPDSQGKGVGTALYEALIAQLRERGIHAVMAGIALPNDASIALHEKVGFEKAAHFKEAGWKFNKWIDVAYWELLIR